MSKKYFIEKEEDLEAKKLWLKKTNKFLSDYFNFIIVFIVASIFIFGFFFLLKPKYEQTVRYINILSRQEQFDYQAKKDELDKIKELLAAYEGISPKLLDQVKAVAPVRKNKEELFPEINYLVSKNQLFLQSVSLSSVSGYQSEVSLPATAAQVRAAENIESVALTLSVLGTDYAALKNFLTSLENNLHLMDVANVTFSPGGAINLTINTYYSKE
jgi:hypothetical protein